MITLIMASCAFARLLSPLAIHPTALVANHAVSSDIPLKTPAGWTSSKNEGATVMTPGDVPEGKAYNVVITPVQGKAGTLDAIYGVAKKMVAEVGTYTASIEPKQAQSEGGWDFQFTIGVVAKGDGAFLAQVMAVKKGDEGGTVIVVSDSIETMQKYSDPFAKMLRELGGSGKPSTPPEVKGDGSVDLQYNVPAGWVETKKEGATVIEASKDEFYDKWRWTLVVLPSQPLNGSLGDNFREYWSSLVSANYESATVPLPLTARLNDGYVCAFDTDESTKHKTSGAQPRMVSVFLMAHGNRFVPMLFISYGYSRQLETDLNQFIETARIPGSSNAKIPMFSSPEIAGDWNEGSASIAHYVTSSGDYAGDASIFTSSSFHLQSDQTYIHYFMAITGSTRLKEKQEGSWSVDEDELVVSHDNKVDRYSLLGYGNDPKAGRFLVLGTYANVKAKISFANPRGTGHASWYKAK